MASVETEVRDFVVSWTAKHLGIAPSDVSDDMFVPDLVSFMEVGAVTLDMTVYISDIQNCTVRMAIDGFSEKYHL